MGECAEHSRRLECIFEQTRDGHRTGTARHRRNRTGHGLYFLEIDIANDFVINSCYTNINYRCA